MNWQPDVDREPNGRASRRRGFWKWPRTQNQRLTRVRTLPFRRASDPRHGSLTAYHRGCACLPCRQANTEAQRKKRKGMAA